MTRPSLAPLKSTPPQVGQNQVDPAYRSASFRLAPLRLTPLRSLHLGWPCSGSLLQVGKAQVCPSQYSLIMLASRRLALTRVALIKLAPLISAYLGLTLFQVSSARLALFKLTLSGWLRPLLFPLRKAPNSLASFRLAFFRLTPLRSAPRRVGSGQVSSGQVILCIAFHSDQYSLKMRIPV